MAREKITPPAFTRMRPDALGDLLLNRGTAFTRDERVRLGIEGLLPPRVETLGEQVARALDNVRGKPNPLEKYRYLSALQGENATLFYRNSDSAISAQMEWVSR